MLLTDKSGDEAAEPMGPPCTGGGSPNRMNLLQKALRVALFCCVVIDSDALWLEFECALMVVFSH